VERFLAKLAVGSMTQAGRIYTNIEQADPSAASRLLPLVYKELRRLAAQRLAREKSPQTLDATALVHEAYLRLVGDGGRRPWRSRAHFFGAAAEAMRRILVERARQRHSLRRGGERKRVPLTNAVLADEGTEARLLAVHELVDALAAEEPAAAQVVKLRYFAGLTIEETADALAISVRTANRHWAYARAWLYERLKNSL
jgi:RNA polymerase sigma factor (TIGR02999 family)